jgi:hypothetical protein
METIKRFWEWVVDASKAIAVIVVVACLVITTITVTQHNADLATVARLTQQTKTLTAKTHTLAQKYANEQAALSAAGKDQLAFAAYLAEVDFALCTAVKADCPTPPTFTSTNSSTTP